MSEGVEIVSAMLACYPNGGQMASGKGYIGALSAVLVTYPAQIARKSKDPIFGVPRECKFLPTPADVIAWCERELAELRKPVEHADRNAKYWRDVGSQREDADYWQKARLTHPTGAELRERYGAHWGIGQPVRKQKVWHSPTDDELRAKYGKRHDDPSTSAQDEADQPIDF